MLMTVQVAAAVVDAVDSYDDSWAAITLGPFADDDFVVAPQIFARNGLMYFVDLDWISH